MPSADGLVGQPFVRREDPALLTGQATFTNDVRVPEGLSLVFVRSQHGHARIDAIDTTGATDIEGIVDVFTWTDIEASEAPGVLETPSERLAGNVSGYPILARDRVRYQGQPVAAVLGETPQVATDGARAVSIAYDPLPAVTDPVDALEGDAPALFDGAPDNLAATGDLGDAAATDRAFAAADRTVSIDLVNSRLVPNAMEPRAALARYDAADDRLAVTMTSQSPHGHRGDLAATLGLSERRIRVEAPRVGGGFGHKGHHYPGEAMTAWCTLELERPVAWTATRTENYAAGAHGRDHRTQAELAVDSGGTIRGLRVETIANTGGYSLGSAPLIAANYGSLLSGQYDVPAIHCETRVAFTNTAPIHTYRGAGRPEAIYVIERLLDLAARELDCDPAELRRRNFISPSEFPYETPVGATYDSGDYERALDTALSGIGYEEFHAEQSSKPDADGRYRGIGLACFVESTGSGFESGLVRVHPDGGVTVFAGTHSHGQGHRTTYAQLVADELGLPIEDIEVVEGDTDRIPAGTGTFGSRSTIMGGNAVTESARSVARKARALAAARLETDAEDVVLEDGRAHVRGAPGRAVDFAAVADAAYGWSEDTDPGLEDTTFFDLGSSAYTFGTHAAVVAVDPATGEIEIERYRAVNDCGPQVNPRIVEGQVHGGVAQGIGQALYEDTRYDADGELLSGAMDEYRVPKATDIPSIETDRTVTESPTNPLGVKGIGEAGTIAAPPAVVNAVCDALAPFGVSNLDMPLTGETVWRAITNESNGSAGG